MQRKTTTTHTAIPIPTNFGVRKGVIIGSYALGLRYAKDIDVVCYEADITCEHVRKDDYQCSFYHRGRRVECLLADKQESFQYMLAEYPDGVSIASINLLYCIKAGHIIYPHRAWDKHIHDYHTLKAMTGDNAHMKSFIDLHRKSTKERLGARPTPKLVGVSKEKFFDDRVVKHYVHDNIHKAVSHTPGISTYEKMQRNPESVECSKDLWELLSFSDKVNCVLEEGYVIALERKIIPTMMGTPGPLWKPHDAFRWALMRICTNLCSGWFRQFALDNYFLIMNAYDPGFVEIFEENISKYE